MADINLTVGMSDNQLRTDSRRAARSVEREFESVDLAEELIKSARSAFSQIEQLARRSAGSVDRDFEPESAAELLGQIRVLGESGISGDMLK